MSPRRRKRSFPPILGRRPRVLILGTLPGDESLRRNEYYGHPQNRFWELLGAVLGEDLRALSYARRVARLKARGVAVWDVVADAHRVGSMDASIRFARPNDVPALIARSGVKAVFFNGKTSEAGYRRHFGDLPEGVEGILLPSTSPAYASLPWPLKIAAWRRLSRYLRGRNRDKTRL